MAFANARTTDSFNLRQLREWQAPITRSGTRWQRCLTTTATKRCDIVRYFISMHTADTCAKCFLSQQHHPGTSTVFSGHARPDFCFFGRLVRLRVCACRSCQSMSGRHIQPLREALSESRFFSLLFNFRARARVSTAQMLSFAMFSLHACTRWFERPHYAHRPRHRGLL